MFTAGPSFFKSNAEPPPVSYATWVGGTNGLVISADNLTISASTTFQSFPESSLASKSISGKMYFEAILGESDPDYGGGLVGFIDQSESPFGNINDGTRYAGGTNSVGFWPGTDGEGGIYSNGNIITNNITTATTIRVGLAIDAATRTAWFCVVGSPWIGGGDPATGTNGVVIGGSLDIYIIGTCMYSQEADSVTLVADPANMLGTAPTGYTAGIAA